MQSTEIKTEAGMEEQPQPQPQAQAQAQPTLTQEIPVELNQQQALQVLVDAARIAQSKGVFSLDDAELVNKAIRAFTPKGPVATNA